ncbi:phosphoribosylformylglycinamidine cyclo-ligase [bacterium]|nr:phosphoribosylformylglycinamidine cyclo-ligase [bacterium]
MEREERGMERLLYWVNKTVEEGRVSLPIGYFANVIDIGGIGIALSIDGVGTKLLVAQMMGKYDTIGIDCVAMNVNDVICVGARALCMLDYLALEEPREDLLEEIGKGLYEGARIAGIAIVGGETAQLREMLRGMRKGYAFDLAGACLGLVPLDRIIVGKEIEDGDVVIGLASSGIHSNGLTLARKVLLKDNLSLYRFSPDLGRTIGEELLEPTKIYCKEVYQIIDSGIRVKALVNITGGGLLNLLRVAKPVEIEIEELPPVPPIFKLIQKEGEISDEEMFRVFNMGVGFCVIVDKDDVDKTMEIIKEAGVNSFILGNVSIARDGESKVILRKIGLVGKGTSFRRE